MKSSAMMGKPITHSGITEQECTNCGTLFVLKRKGTKYCGRKCQQISSRNNSRTQLRKQVNRLRFIGVDGEGVDRPDNTHEYVMLSVGDETLWKDGNELSLREILSFLWERYCENPDAAFVGFFLGYDFNHWFKHLPENTARLLFTNDGIARRKSSNPRTRFRAAHPVVWEGWEIEVLASRRVKLRPHTHIYSPYSGACRNRTCDSTVELLPSEYGEPDDIPVGEMEFEIPETCVFIPWAGTASEFWKKFRPIRRKIVKGWMYICDTGPFWQSSFLNVINPEGWTEPVCTDNEYQLIVRGKSDRGIVAERHETHYFEEMRQYNILENDILARVTERLNVGFLNETITIKLEKENWYGPGRAAQVWMDMLHARIANPEAVRTNRESGIANGNDAVWSNEGGIRSADIYSSVPAWFMDAARASYYGGWFEQFMHGHIGDVWEYDINSAYPFIIASLPCLHTEGVHNGQYLKGNDHNPPEEGYTLIYGKVMGSDLHIGSMPHRTKRGAILRPHVTEGWYWQHEIMAASRAGLIDSVEIQEWVSYIPCDCSSPFNPDDIGIERMYNLRLEVGKNSPQGKGFKLVYNSTYGKTAQSIGNPKYSNAIYASLITTGCRTLILEAIATHPERSKAVSMVATDGIYFTSPHPGLSIDKSKLGAWDVTAKTGMTQLMPGVYWDDKTREKIRDGKAPSLKSRGVNAKDLAKQIANLDREFALLRNRLVDAIPDELPEWPEIEFRTNFLMDSCKLALQRGKWNTAGRITHGAKRKISSDPESKRVPIPFIDSELGVIRTGVYETGPDSIESLPYPKYFGKPLDEGFFGERIGRDGDDGLQYFRDLLV